MSHTPGPWRPTTTQGQDSKEPFMVWSDQIGAAVAHVYNRCEMGWDNHATQRANARLIAAAPEMLGAIRAMLEAYQKWDRRADGGEDDLHYAATMLQSAAEAAVSRQAIDGTV